MPADAILQLQNRSHVRRLLAYFDGRPGGPGPAFRVWPAGGAYGARAEPLTPAACPRHSSGLLLVSGITVSAAEFVEFVRGSLPLSRALARLYWFDAAGEWPLSPDADALVAILKTLTPPSGPVRVMATPRALQASLMDALDALPGWTPSPTGHAAVLAAVDLGGRGKSGVRAALVHPGAVLSDTTPERERGAFPSRAVAKLAEVLAVAGVARGRLAAVIDVGAAPGGWTEHLAGAAGAAVVVAVDPAALAPSALAAPGVIHVPMLSSDPGAVAAVRAALGEGALADALTCDANLPPKHAAAAVLPLLDLLKPGGLVVLTLKCLNPGAGDDKAFAARAAAEVLAPVGVRPRRAVWLVANTLSERTLVLVKDGEGGEGGRLFGGGGEE